MKSSLLFCTYCMASVVALSAAEARTWTDASGRYSVDADLVDFNDRTVVLQRADRELVAVPIDKLSTADREYLKTKPAQETAAKSVGGMQTWTLRDGRKILGRVVDYVDRDITLQRRRGRIYVNDRPLANLPMFYQELIPQIVVQQTNLQRSDPQSLEAWLVRQRGEPRTFHVEGVVLETDIGDEFALPFFLFAEQDEALLKLGWNEWLAAQGKDDYHGREDIAFLLKSLAAARNRDSQVSREIALLQLKLQAVEVGLTSLWEVTLYPAAGNGGPPQWVVVAGRDSRQATHNALTENPGYVAGPVRRVAGG